MPKNKPLISIIIVNYKVKKELFKCLESIYKSKITPLFEIIVVDNDEVNKIQAELYKKFPKVQYIKNTVNNGWGGGVNVGERYASGIYLYLLNPDTLVFPGTIDKLYNFIVTHKNAGIVSSLILDPQKKPHTSQGSEELTPLKALVVYSLINKIFPNNQIAKRFWPLNVNKIEPQEVAIPTLTAALVRKDAFEKAGKFDENFFLYFEEFDLGKRIKKLGYKNYIIPESKIVHAWGLSSQTRKDIKEIFARSRFYYFKKHFGILSALLVEGFLRISKYTFLMAGILGLGLFLRLYNISQSMPFIGDQGWFYLSARDMVVTGNIPLVGIASSHPWLHQGALWTYFLAFGFKLLGFTPFTGAWISVFFGILAIWGIYALGELMFSQKVGLIAAALFATSPLVLASDRMPYHTSPIPLFSILFIYCLYKWVSGNKYYFPIIIFVLGLLYNLEIATVLLGIVTIVTLFYCFIVKRDFVRETFRPKFLILSLIAFVVSMLPMLIYDVGHGFPQTLKFLAWIGYKVLVLFGYPVLHPSINPSISQMLSYSFKQLTQLIFPYSGWVALGIFIGSICIASIRYKGLNIRLLLFLNGILVVGFLAAGTASGAYLPMMFPGMILMVALGIDALLRKLKIVKLVGIVVILGLVFFNGYYSFVMNSVDHSFSKRLDAAKYIVEEADGKAYNLKGRGPGSKFESFTMNYEYLAWWLRNGPSKKPERLKFVVGEEKGIRVQKYD